MVALLRWLFALALFSFLFVRGADGTLCLNMFGSGHVKPKIGRHAIVEPWHDRYYLQTEIEFHCPKDYYFDDVYFKNYEKIWLKCHNYGWSGVWPTCRGKYENVTCPNEYIFARHFNKSWLNETPNRKHSLYSTTSNYYSHLSILKFKCPSGMNFLGAKGLVVMQSTCQETGEWSKEWPMCKGHTCSPYRLENAVTGNENRLFLPGTMVYIKCWPGYYLRGLNWSVCRDDLSWSGFRECVTYDEYVRLCRQSGDIFESGPKGEPRCRSRVIDYEDIRRKENDKSKRITLGSAIPLSALFVIFLTLSSLYVRRLRTRNGMLALAIRHQNRDHAIEMFLPTYEDAQKSKPTTPPPSFEESQSMIFPDSSRRISRPPASPPPYNEEENVELVA